MKTKAFIILITTIFVCCSPKKELPILSNYIDENGAKKSYLIDDFQFTSQLGKIFTDENTKNKIHIVNFFFTSCPSICPPMREKLIDIATTFQKENLLVLSITIDLKLDSISVLNHYSDATSIPKDKWVFLKGSPSELSKIAKKFKTSFSNSNNSGDFYHSSYVALVDTQQQIRGFYDILNEEAVILLKEDISMLLNE